MQRKCNHNPGDNVMKEKMKMKEAKGKSEAEKYRAEHMEKPSKVGKDSMKKMSEKPSKMKGGRESMKGGMKGYSKSK